MHDSAKHFRINVLVSWFRHSGNEERQEAELEVTKIKMLIISAIR